MATGDFDDRITAHWFHAGEERAPVHACQTPVWCLRGGDRYGVAYLFCFCDYSLTKDGWQASQVHSRQVQTISPRTLALQYDTRTRGITTEAVMRGRVAGTRNFSNSECTLPAIFARERVPTCQMEMELSPFLASGSLKLLAICPISNLESTDSSRKRNLR